MGSFKVRAVSLVMMVAVAGTPAFAAACAALCMPAIDHGSPIATSATATHHATDGSMPASDAHATAETRAQAPRHHPSLTQQNERSRGASCEEALEVAAAADHSCCTSDDTVRIASTAAVRSGAGALLATAAVLATPFHSLIPLRSGSEYSPPVAPSPTPALLVLRV